MKLKLKIFLVVMTALIAFPLYAQEGWDKVIEEVKSSIVMIEIESFSKLENENPGCYQATGFIVDADNGIILTNRHVIGASPSTSKATFWNKEKISVRAIYYDPMHDFGFYKYNPALIKWMKPNSIELGDSSKVKVGEEIRVLGNNASEGFSILEGTVSWVKKNAPSYSNPDTYRDFNTYYFQTSADVSGGSSGGPIINNKGQAVAVNSSSKRYTTVSWGLPINLVKNALKVVGSGDIPKRGGLGARVIFATFNEIADYGFPKATIKEIKKNNKDMEGLLTILETIPGTDASKHLKAGDVIWELGGEKILDDFFRYEDILDKKTGEKIEVTVIRDSKEHSYKLGVLDMERLKTKSFLRIGGDYFSSIPIFIAFSYNIGLDGVFTPYIKYNFSERIDFPEFLVLKEFDSKPIKTPEELFEILNEYKSGSDAKLKYVRLKQSMREEEKAFEVNWKWFKPEFFKIDEISHEWIKVN